MLQVANEENEAGDGEALLLRHLRFADVACERRDDAKSLGLAFAEKDSRAWSDESADASPGSLCVSAQQRQGVQEDGERTQES